MASVQTSKYDGRYLKLTVVEESTSIENNTSTVRWTLESIGGNSNYYNVYSVEVKINNSTVYGPTTKTWDSKVFPAAKGSTTGTVTIDHNNDGTASPLPFSLRGSIFNNNPQTYSDTLTLTTIPRASSISVPDANIGSSTNIVINKVSSIFTTYLYYLPDGQSGNPIYIDGTNNQVYGWTVPTSLYNLIQSQRTIGCTFYADTYSENTFIGTKTTRATFKANVYPTINSITAQTIDQKTYDLTGNTNTIIKGVSTLQVQVNATAGTGASIDHYVIGGVSQSTNSRPIYNANSNSYTVSVYDTRGEPPTTQSITMPNQMVEYVPLTINANISRNQPTDGKVKISYNGNYFNGSFGSQNNNLTVQYRSIEKGDSWDNVSWINLSPTVSGSTYSQSNYEISGYDYTKQYEFQIRAFDEIQTRAIEGITVSKGQPIYWWDNNGIYLGNGKSINTVVNNLLNDTVYNDNANNYNRNSMFYFGSNTNSNVPADWSHILTMGNGNNDAAQIGVSVVNENIYTRICNSGTWHNWKRLANASEIPTKTSDLTNDSGFMSSIPSGYLKETVLYNNATGSNGDIPLNDSVANYTYIEIYFKDNNGKEGGYVKLHNINGKEFGISLIEATSTTTYIRRTKYSANGSSLIVGYKGYIRIDDGQKDNSTNYLYITKVVGLS